MDFYTTSLIVIGILLLVFGGRGTISKLMGGAAKEAFKRDRADSAKVAPPDSSIQAIDHADSKQPTESASKV